MWLNTSTSFWNPDDFYAGATSNAKIMQSVHRAAKNIIYTVVNSNAVLTYADDGTTQEGSASTASVFPWRALLWTVDIVVWVAAAVGIVLPLCLYIRDRKTLAEQEKKED